MGARGFEAVVGTDSGYVAVGSGRIWTSRDAVEWTQQAVGPPPLHGLVAASPGVVVVGGGTYGFVWFAPDGVTWSLIQDDEVFGSAGINDVTYFEGKYWAVGAAISPPTPAVWSSVDGLTWIRVDADGERFTGAGMRLVTAGGPGLVAIGERGPGNETTVVWTSPDGTQWQVASEGPELFGVQQSPGPLLQPADVVALGDSLIAVSGSDSSGSPGAWLSADNGQSWRNTSDQPRGNIALVHDGIVTPGPAGLVYSPDGESWQSVVSFQNLSMDSWSHTSMEPYHVATAGDRLIVLGSNHAYVGGTRTPGDRILAVGPAK